MKARLSGRGCLNAGGAGAASHIGEISSGGEHAKKIESVFKINQTGTTGGIDAVHVLQIKGVHKILVGTIVCQTRHATHQGRTRLKRRTGRSDSWSGLTRHFARRDVPILLNVVDEAVGNRPVKNGGRRIWKSGLVLPFHK